MSDVQDGAEEADFAPRPPRPEFETLLGRALRLRCPRCGEGKLFARWHRMPRQCAVCGFRFERGPGYFLGSSYVNYGLTALTMSAIFLIGRIAFQVPAQRLVWPLFGYCLIVPLLLFRHARALWLALDCQLDRSVLIEEPDERSLPVHRHGREERS